MNTKQKQLAEKTVKLKFNGMINALKDTLTTQEADNPALARISAAYGDVQWHKYKASGYPEGVGGLLRQAQEHTLEMRKLKTEYERQVTLIKDKLDALQEQINSLVDKENEIRREKRDEAKRARQQLIRELRADRDNAIINIAFDGEAQEMLDFLANIPTPMDTAKRLGGGQTLTKALPEATGIGEKNPDNLYDYGDAR